MRLTALALVAAAASAQTVNTQVNGLALTNGLGSATGSSSISYLTDNDTSTFVFNVGSDGSASLQGTFSGTISSSATGIYIVGVAANFGGGPIVTYNGPTFSVQLLLTGGFTGALTYGDADSVITNQKINTLSYDSAGYGQAGIDPEVVWGTAHYYSYIYVPFTAFNATYDQVVGIKFSDFTSPNPDIGYIGIGYSTGGGGSPVVPEPSTYGLMLGGLALAGEVIRRRRGKQA